ncbi:KpsF/GutQ family sugar-phosphate isomerase [Sinorhizobium numidicum]|uniref:KpsF/GutQ family sugar-phosphate isomerase n=1 Tax=Sinorhizobium numidicum TaxID=680248 RepID=A0ABY8CRD9_9HYPH|nr:KpsF/GutQ family sugar-phosphate isomerase [Sinorhizobium numidicum]WEX75220.1 KpsF/GutQ family sugar-phosphate isomerase [Sinorhizobium numidicum]WEX81215.1 KpsF/GutQ family sugar-phosphate isomerase [Sinorhizobium numidicum]
MNVLAKSATDTVAKSAVRQSVARTIATAADGINALAACLSADQALSGSFVDAVELIASSRGRVVVSGIGKSGHIGRKIAATMASTGTSAYFVHPTEASHGDLGMITSEDLLILLSWSGETVELGNMLTYAKRFNVPVVSITSNADSLISRNSNVAITLPKVQEACPHGLAPTTSAMLQLAVGDALAIALVERRGFSAHDFKTFHPGGKLGSQLLLAHELAHCEESVPLLPLGSPMSDAIIEMSSKGFGVVGVVDGDKKLAGVITDGDLRRHMSSDLLKMTVDAIMSHRPRLIKGSMLASAAMELMETQKVTVLFLIDDLDRPTGILHIHDLLRAGVV